MKEKGKRQSEIWERQCEHFLKTWWGRKEGKRAASGHPRISNLIFFSTMVKGKVGDRTNWSRGSALQKRRTLFEEYRRILEKRQGFWQTPTESRKFPWSWLHRILNNPLESAGILKNPKESQEPSVILRIQRTSSQTFVKTPYKIFEVSSPSLLMLIIFAWGWNIFCPVSEKKTPVPSNSFLSCCGALFDATANTCRN